MDVHVHVHVREERRTRNDSLTNNDETIYRVPTSHINQTIQCLLLNSRPTWKASLIHSLYPCQLVLALIGCTRSSETSSPLFVVSSLTTKNKPRSGSHRPCSREQLFIKLEINAHKSSLMPPRRRQRPLPRGYALFNAGVRLVAWLTSLAAVLMLAYVGKEWPSKSQVVVAGALGVSFFLTNI